MKISSILGVISFSLVFSGCFGSGKDTAGDSMGDNSIPFSDAYIEYPGPNARWSGPQSFILHSVTRGSGKTKVYVSSGIAPGKNPKASGVKAVSESLSVEAAREELARFYASLQSREEIYRGCLSPIRIKLIRADGVLIERQGCRGQTGWPRVASEVVNHLIESSVSAK